MEGTFWSRRLANGFIIGSFIVSVLLFIFVMSVQRVSADPPTPDVECEETCTLTSYIFYCNACSDPTFSDKYIRRYWCCDPCIGCYPIETESCVRNVECP